MPILVPIAYFLSGVLAGFTVTQAIRCIGYDIREAEAEKSLADIKEQLATALDEE